MASRLHFPIHLLSALVILISKDFKYLIFNRRMKQAFLDDFLLIAEKIC